MSHQDEAQGEEGAVLDEDTDPDVPQVRTVLAEEQAGESPGCHRGGAHNLLHWKHKTDQLALPSECGRVRQVSLDKLIALGALS